MTQLLDPTKLLTAYISATKRVFLFDYDGTLTPIIQNAAEAILPSVHLEWLTALASSPRNAVWVISGRDQAFLQAQLGSLTTIGLVAEHGAFMRRPNSSEWENLAPEADIDWQATVKRTFDEFKSRHAGAFIEEKRVATVLHYRRVEVQESAELDAQQCKISLEKALGRLPVNIVSGKCVIEARPANVHKGNVVDRIVKEEREKLGCFPQFVFCAGDDVTDEDMFRALQAMSPDPSTVFTVSIGAHDKLSEAEYFLPEPTMIWEVIGQFNDSDGSRTPFLKLL